jgi:hypothetical protein
LPQKLIIPLTPLTDAEVLKTLKDMEDVIRYRLRMTEIIPVEMAKYRIGMVYSILGTLALMVCYSGRSRLFHRFESL